MKLCFGFACAAAILLCGLSTAKATVISSTFDSSTESWTGSGANLAHSAAGGNPGGYLQATDPSNSVMTVFAPSAFLGDISSFDGGSISFDAQLFKVTGAPQPPFGTISISDGITTATLDLAAGPATLGTWTSYSAVFNAATWGLSSGAWNTLLSNVTNISLILEATYGQGEIVGLDNFSLFVEDTTPSVPEPSSIALLTTGFWGMAGFGYFRRRRQQATA